MSGLQDPARRSSQLRYFTSLFFYLFPPLPKTPGKWQSTKGQGQQLTFNFSLPIRAITAFYHFAVP
jgi:hypothetical protein